MLLRSQERFKEIGATTFALKILGRTMVMTLEPQNLKTIQALEHKKWGLGTRRKVSFKPLLGDGKIILLSFVIKYPSFCRSVANALVVSPLLESLL